MNKTVAENIQSVKRKISNKIREIREIREIHEDFGFILTIVTFLVQPSFLKYIVVGVLLLWSGDSTIYKDIEKPFEKEQLENKSCKKDRIYSLVYCVPQERDSMPKTNSI